MLTVCLIQRGNCWNYFIANPLCCIHVTLLAQAFDKTCKERSKDAERCYFKMFKQEVAKLSLLSTPHDGYNLLATCWQPADKWNPVDPVTNRPQKVWLYKCIGAILKGFLLVAVIMRSWPSEQGGIKAPSAAPWIIGMQNEQWFFARIASLR